MTNDSDAPTEPGNVLLLDDLCRVLKTSPRTVRRRLDAGVFPIPTLPGIDKKLRWSAQAVRRFLETGRRTK